jgi:aspartate dehydrogenase
MDAALIGCGFIGSLIAKHISTGEIPLKLRYTLDRNPEKVERVQALFDKPPAAAESIDEIAESDVGLVIEAASIEAMHSFAKPILSSGKDMMIMSVGAFATPGVYKTVEEICLRSGAHVYLPSGAVGGLDAVSAASVGRLELVELRTIKNPKSLEGAPYIEENKINLEGLKEAKEIFNGTATEAIAGFPANVNVAATLGLAGIGVVETRVKIIADPGVSRNIHEIRATGDFGELIFRTENMPAPDNPRTSLLAALSAVAMLKKITSPIKIG